MQITFDSNHQGMEGNDVQKKQVVQSVFWGGGEGGDYKQIHDPHQKKC